MWTDNETSEDLLGFSVHTSIIKKVVMNENNLPITIGLYGDWGSGKSSLLKIIENELNKDKDTVVIYFDGWSFESFDDAKMALIQGIIDELERNEKFLNKVEDKLNGIFKKLKKSVNWMRVLQTGVKTIIPIAS
ncbi:MAG: P-loop NTPase fold protein, partial [Bacteroidales bacterium]